MQLILVTPECNLTEGRPPYQIRQALLGSPDHDHHLLLYTVWSAGAQVKDLKEMCKERKIKGYSAMRKSQLVRTLKPILAEEM